MFWKKIMPACIEDFPWSGDLSKCSNEKEWGKGLKGKVNKMDEREFDLFLAEVVMAAAKKQIMGVDLTEKIEFLKALRD